MDDETGIRIVLVGSIATVLISAPTAAAWLARGFESLAAVSVLCLGLAIVSGAFALVRRSWRDRLMGRTP